MLNKVDVISPSGSILELPIYESDYGYFVTNIEGLDPVKANMVSSGFANIHGEQYQSSRREKRNLTISIGFDPDFATTTVRDLRNYLYNFLMPTSQVTLSFVHDDGFVAKIRGVVEDFESKLFVKEPEATVPIVCFDPDFYDSTEISLPLSTTSASTFTTITNPATVDTGFLLTLYANRAIDTFTISARTPGGTWQDMVISGYDIEMDEKVIIQTLPGSKFVNKVTVGNETSSFLYALDPSSTWLTLKPGDNDFRVRAAGAAIPYDLVFSPRYGGL